MPVFADSESLLAEIQNDLFDAVQESSSRIIEVLERNIQDIVYDPWTQYVRVYKRRGRDGGFLGSWTNRMEADGRSIKSTIFSDPDSMEPPSDDDFFINETGGDVFVRSLGVSDRRDIMDAAIAEGKWWDFYVPENAPKALPKGIENWWTRPRDYWSPTIVEVEKKRMIEKSFDEVLKSKGIKFTRKKI